MKPIALAPSSPSLSRSRHRRLAHVALALVAAAVSVTVVACSADATSPTAPPSADPPPAPNAPPVATGDASTDAAPTKQPTPVTVAVADLTLGAHHSCALTSDGKVFCWGANASGQLGYGDKRARGAAAMDMGIGLAPVALPAGRTAKAIQAGSDRTCALLDDGSVRCWGDNDYGELGTGAVASSIGGAAGQMGDKLVPMNLPAGVTVTALDVGGSSTCALASDGTAYCFGLLYYGTGIGQNTDYGTSPYAISFGAGRKLVQISGCGVLETSKVVCWGKNVLKNDGVGNIEFIGAGSGTPTVPLGVGFDAKKAVNVGNARCALSTDGRVKCWGGNYFTYEPKDHGLGHDNVVGATSTADMGDALPALDFGTSKKVLDVANGGHGCVLLEGGTVKCWGANLHGELGLGDNVHRGSKPGEMGTALPAVAVGTGRTVKRIVVGESHTCAILDDDRVKCWGANADGQLGLGDAVDRGVLPGTMGDALPYVDLRELR